MWGGADVDDERGENEYDQTNQGEPERELFAGQHLLVGFSSGCALRLEFLGNAGKDSHERV